MKPWKLAFCLALVALLLPGGASAETPEQLFDHAVRRAQRGSLTAALEQFREVQRLRPTWSDVPFNIGMLAERLGDPTTCMLGYQRYLQLEPGGADAAEARNGVDRCASRAGTVGTLRISNVTPSDAQVIVAGFPVSGSNVEFRLPAGAHRVTGTAPDHEPFAEQVLVDAARPAVVVVRLQEIPYYGAIRVIVDRPDAEVTIDGRPYTPDGDAGQTMRTGRYLVVVRKPGHHMWQRYITVERDDVEDVHVRLLTDDFILP